MNLILFSEEETKAPVPLTDARAVHLLQTLRRREGEAFDAGIINGVRLKGVIRKITAGALEVEFQAAGSSPPLNPVALLVGLPRPQTARKILQEATSLGVGAIHFTATEKGEPSYGSSKLWSTGEYRRHLIAGAEQAFTTRIPETKRHTSLAEALDELLPDRAGIALDNYEATAFLRDYEPAKHPRPPTASSPTSAHRPIMLAVGPERGWSAAERDLFRARNIPLLQLGSNVLRTETACLCSLAVLLAKLELL